MSLIPAMAAVATALAHVKNQTPETYMDDLMAEPPDSYTRSLTRRILRWTRGSGLQAALATPVVSSFNQDINSSIQGPALALPYIYTLQLSQTQNQQQTNIRSASTTPSVCCWPR